jgi:hypothetical protein
MHPQVFGILNVAEYGSYRGRPAEVSRQLRLVGFETRDSYIDADSSSQKKSFLK